MHISALKKQTVLSIVALLGGSSFCLGSITININADTISGEFQDNFFADAAGVPLAAGNQILIGHFENESAVIEARDNFSDVIDLFQQFGTGTVDISEPVGSTVPPGAATGSSTLNPATDFTGKQVYILATKTSDNGPLAEDYLNLLEYGIFTSTVSHGGEDAIFDWIFEAGEDGGARNLYTDAVNVIVVGSSTTIAPPNFGDLPYLTLFEPAAVPEPSTYAAIFGLLTLAFVALRRRRT
jgi:hypothetical protein